MPDHQKNPRIIAYLKSIIKSIFKHFGILIARKEPNPIIDGDILFRRIYEQCKPYTMTSKERMFALYQSTKFIIQAEIPGDIIECGVWKGGSSMLVALTLKELGVTDRNIYLFDTFTGMPEPEKMDYRIEDKKHATYFENSNWCNASLTEVQKNMEGTGYPEECIFYIKGKVENTIPNTLPRTVSILRLDTDFYKSTKHELKHLFPNLSQHGVLIIDDYGYWAGAKKAVDEFFQECPILFHKIDSAGIIGMKIS